MEVTANATMSVEDAGLRRRAKERLYVLFQVAGWGLFLLIEMASTLAMPEFDSVRSRTEQVSAICMIVTMGLLMTHFFRRLMAGWGWKQMNWRALLPRVLVAAAIGSLLWNGLGVAYTRGLLQEPWSHKYSFTLICLMSWFYGAALLVGWLCLYFFYHLFERLNRSEIERFQLMTSVKEAELRALKSQVNPHFIFNSLNSLRALIGEDPARARQAVTQLANLLRYSLQSGQLETVPFEDELRIVNDYLALEQVRHEERLRLRLDVAPDTLQLPVPPMLLQTLVENAIKYGISPRPEGGEIAIVARRDGGVLRLQVTNPGDVAANGVPTSTGVGLQNAAERLRLIFGAGASLRLRSEAPARVVAEAVIPLAASA
jgi:signal transduction histidine kinase